MAVILPNHLKDNSPMYLSVKRLLTASLIDTISPLFVVGRTKLALTLHR